MDESATGPRGDLTMRVPAMPADANAEGDVFGGWVMSQMDLAAWIRGSERAHGRVTTVAVNALAFKKPVKIGDVLCVYTTIERIGHTSITLLVEAWAQRHLTRDRVKVTEGSFVVVALDTQGRPVAVPTEDA
ncbi:acyl-CoA thioesterase [Consotaella aegiceratis]|uniref:acyl-CoA thioesterase n=1 Tax=Consotaella aegiceratis TaxID=3097961 RepID=UPI002F3F9C76